jgi:hypothetical protein
MLKPMEYALICQSVEEVAMRSVHKVLIEVEANILPNVGYPQGI